MLGVAADDFHLAQDDMIVTTQEEMASNGPSYPAPHNGESGGRPVAAVIPVTYSMLPGMGSHEGMENSFIPGIGDMAVEDSMMPGMGTMAVEDSMMPGMGAIADMAKNPVVIGVVGLAFLFMTKTGKNLRKKIGLA